MEPPVLAWLLQHGQTQRTIARFWSLVLTSALNESTDRIGLRYARKVFVDGFLRHRRGFEVELRTVPVGRLYGEELQTWFEKHGVRLLVNEAAKALCIADNRVCKLEMRRGEPMAADWYIATVPFDRLLDLLPADVVDRQPTFANLRRLETSPITSVHLWYDRPVMPWPHLVLVDGVGQWVFNRGEVTPGEHYVQVVVSASRPFRGLAQDEIRSRVVDELARLLPAARPRFV